MATSIWWARWPGALLMGVVALVLVSAGLMTSALYFLLSTPDNSGTDISVEAIPLWLTLVYLGQLVVCLAMPILAVVLARKKWAGYLLVSLVVSACLGAAGLVQLGLL